MNRFNTAVLCLLLAAGCGKSSGGGADEATLKHAGNEATFISGATFIAGDGSAPIEEATIIIDKDVIFQVGKKGELKPPRGSLQHTGMEGHTIIPAMINLNAYPGLSNTAGEFGAKNYNRESVILDLNRYAYYGVTAVVAGGDSDGLAFQVRDEIRGGQATGAQLYTSGRGIAAKGSSGNLGDIPLLVSTEADAREAVGKLADQKADVIVLWANGMKSATSAAVVDEAHKRKLKVLADAPGLSEAKDVVKAGVDALIASVRENDVDDELISLMKEKKVAMAPALSSLEARFTYTDSPKWLGESAMREVYPSTLSAYLEHPVFVSRMNRSPEAATARTQFATASKNLKKLADSGVTIAFGTGSGLPYTFPGYFEHREMELMSMAGLSGMDIIKAASKSSAETLGAADLGALTPGKKANFLVISDDPLKNITATKQIDEVWLDGKQPDRREMTRKAKDVKVTQLGEKDLREEANIQATIARDAAEAKEQHYGNGKFLLAKPATTVASGLVIQTPRRSNVNKSGGPPYRVTVSVPGAAAGDLRAFYAETLKSWRSAGDCWEKDVPGDTKKFRACAEASSGQIILNINVQ